MSPDLSCAEFPERPVSTFEGYDPKTNPCPPMGEMKGMGRYRHSVHSTKEWEIELIKKGLGSFADYVDDDFEIAEAPGVVKHIRKESTASEVSGPHSEYSEGTDPDTGSYVCVVSCHLGRRLVQLHSERLIAVQIRGSWSLVGTMDRLPADPSVENQAYAHSEASTSRL